MASNLLGKTLLGQYRVDEFLDAGGMGSVYRVWDLQRNVPLAMKVLHADLAEDPGMFERFKKEARALQNLAHPNIVPFYGIFESGDLIFMLERFIDGGTLKDLLKQKNGEPLSPNEALIFLKAICSALGYAHKFEVVHCDVKSANVLIDQGGNIFLGDFGIARYADSTATTMASAGTPAYMAPEQVRGEVVTPRTDIYSLGILLFEMLTGQRPFRGSEPELQKTGSTQNERIRRAHQKLPPPEPTNINPKLNKRISTALLKALAKKPSERFQTMQEFLSEICESVGVSEDNIPSRISLNEPIISTAVDKDLDIDSKEDDIPVLLVIPELVKFGVLDLRKENSGLVEATIKIKNSGKGTLFGEVISNVPWLTVSPQKFNCGSGEESVHEVALGRDAPSEKNGRYSYPDAITIKSNIRVQTLSVIYKVLEPQVKKQKFFIGALLIVMVVVSGILVLLSPRISGNQQYLSSTQPTSINGTPYLQTTVEIKESQFAMVTATITKKIPSNAISSSATTIPTQTLIPSPTKSFWVTLLERSNIRSGPGTNFNKIGIFDKNIEFLAIGRNRDGLWLNILLGDGRNGWILSSLVQMNFSWTELPEVSAPPTPTIVYLTPTSELQPTNGGQNPSPTHTSPPYPIDVTITPEPYP